ADQAPARIAGRIRAPVVPGHPSRIDRILRQGQGVPGALQLRLRNLTLDPPRVGLYRWSVGNHCSASVPAMPIPALALIEKKFERHRRLFELKCGELEKELGRHIQLFEQKKGALERKLEEQFENHRKRFGQQLETQKRKVETRIRRFEE